MVAGPEGSPTSNHDIRLRAMYLSSCISAKFISSYWPMPPAVCLVSSLYGWPSTSNAGVLAWYFTIFDGLRRVFKVVGLIRFVEIMQRCFVGLLSKFEHFVAMDLFVTYLIFTV